MPPLNLMVMDYIPHLRRSNYCDNSFEHVKSNLNCYGFACRRAGVAEPGSFSVESVRLSILQKTQQNYPQDSEIQDILKSSNYFQYNSIYRLKKIADLLKERALEKKDESAERDEENRSAEKAEKAENDRKLKLFNDIMQEEGQSLRKLLKKESGQFNLACITNDFIPTDERNDLVKLLERDGLLSLSQAKGQVGTLIAAFEEPGDFHFFRLEADGWWNCLPGVGIERQVAKFEIPKKEHLRYFGLENKFTFVGYFLVPPHVLVCDRKGCQPQREGLKCPAKKPQITNGDRVLLTQKKMKKAN